LSGSISGTPCALSELMALRERAETQSVFRLHRERSIPLLFTDLDHCFLDNATSQVENARPALEALRSHGIPLILVSRKTRAEIEALRQRLAHQDPFIVESGAAVFVPLGTFDFPLERSRWRSPYQVIELGTPYAMLRDVLRQVEDAVHSPLRGFGDLPAEEIMRATGLSHEEALRAKLREYDEPFLMTGPRTLIEAVHHQISTRGLRCTQGTRFFHLTGANDPARAADLLLHCYRRKWEQNGYPSLETVVIGENLHDLPLLGNADHPVIVQKPDGSYDPHTDLPRLIRAPGIGPTGWHHAVMDLLKRAA
jgi:mannosyl-3-phosphoglycerate phosphatase